MTLLQRIVERIERQNPPTDRIELSLAEIEELLETARTESLQQLKDEIPRMKQRARERGYNASQAIGYMDNLISWQLTDH